jgi:FkbH-like protein
LINKTNQFNLTTLRATEAEVEALLCDDQMLTAALVDRNTDYGLVSVMWGQREGTDFILKNWVMSCRVFNRKLEYWFFGELTERLVGEGVTRIHAQYVPSKKNKPVAELLDKLGFERTEETAEIVKYEINLSGKEVGPTQSVKELYS